MPSARIGTIHRIRCQQSHYGKRQSGYEGKYDLHISVCVYTDTSLDADGRVCEEWIYWDFDIISTSSGRRMVDENDEYESYEAALSAGIEAALKLI